MLTITSKIKHMIALFYEWDLTNFSHTKYASLFNLGYLHKMPRVHK